MLAALDPAHHRRTGCDLGVGSDGGAGQQGRARSHACAGTDLDVADVDHVAVDPPAGQVHLRLDRAAVAEGDQAGDRWERVHVHAVADLSAQRSGEVDHPGGTGEVGCAAGLGEPLGDPQSQVHRPAARIIARLHPGEQHADPARGDGHPAQRGDEDDERRQHHPPVHRLDPRCVGEPCEHVVDHREPGDPLQPRESCQRYRQRHLRKTGPAGSGTNDAFLGHRAGVDVVEHLRQRAEPRMVVEIRDRHRGEALTQGGDQLCRRQRTASLGEEVGLGVGDRHPEYRGPALGHPRLGGVQVAGRLVVAGRRQRPGQRVAVDLARRAGRQFVHQDEPGDQRGGQLVGEPVAGECDVEVGVG